MADKTSSLLAWFKPHLPAMLISLSISLFVAMGWGFKTPNSTVTALQAQVDTVRARSESDHDLLVAIARGQCLDRPERETKLMGLDCKALLHQ
jgi:hypothetical protein